MPYQIDPGTNPGGEEFEAYNRRRWGGSGWTRRLIEEGRRDGANFADWRWWPSTLKAHQLVRYAEERGGVPRGGVKIFGPDPDWDLLEPD